jgi:hypothetical protein
MFQKVQLSFWYFETLHFMKSEVPKGLQDSRFLIYLNYINVDPLATLPRPSSIMPLLIHRW